MIENDLGSESVDGTLDLQIKCGQAEGHERVPDATGRSGTGKHLFLRVSCRAK